MRTLLLKHDYIETAAKQKGTHPAPSHADQVIDQDTRLVAPDGSTTAVLLTQRIDPHLHRRAYALWRTVDGLPSNRATALGTTSLHRSVSRDGTPSPRSGVNVRVLDVVEARQGILGYSGHPCHKTTLTKRWPELLDRNKQLVKRVDQLYARYMPTSYATQVAEVKKAPRRRRLWQTAFTTIYIAKNFRTAYHTDRGNLRGVMSALLPMGNFAGGQLVLARWRIAIAFKPGDLLLFDPQQLHGNLPFEGERLSAAIYCSRHIAEYSK